MKCSLSLCWCALVAVVMTGCAHVSHPSNPASRQTVRILAHSPEQYAIRVDKAQGHRAGYDGLVSFEVPPLPAGDTVYLFGFIKVADHNPENVPAIQLWKGGLVVRRLSLHQLYELPLDSDNCRLLKMK